MKNLHIANSYRVWGTKTMKRMIREECKRAIGFNNPESELHRSYTTMYIEWWLHNIGYYLTLPLCFSNAIRRLNERFKHVDLEEWPGGKPPWLK